MAKITEVTVHLTSGAPVTIAPADGLTVTPYGVANIMENGSPVMSFGVGAWVCVYSGPVKAGWPQHRKDPTP